MFEAIGDFFKDIGNWISGVFGGKEDTPTPPKPSIEVGPLELVKIEIDPEDLKTYFDPESGKADEVEEEIEGQEYDEVKEEKETKPEDEYTPDMKSTPANDASEDGIQQAFFAKKVLKKVKTSNVAESYEYKFKGDINVGKDRNKIAANIVTNSEKDASLGDRYISAIDVLSVMPNGDYKATNTISIPAKKIEKEVSFEKIESAALESDIYVFAKTANLDGKEITIEIREKDELIVGASAPLPVLKRDDTSDTVEKSEELEEIIELKATADEGMVAIPIRLRPKTAEDFKEWQDKLAGGKEDGTHDYLVQNVNGFTIETETEKSSIAKNIETSSNSKLSPDHKVKIEDILKKLSVGQKFSSQEKITLPKYLAKKNTELLWLKASAQGEKEFHDKEFLNESDASYFKIGNNCSCNRNLTLEELTKIINELRRKEGLPEDILFDSGNCRLPTSDKTFEKFTEEFNTVCSTYKITSCIRKVHFISQIYHEADRFRTTKEYDENGRYKPYIGRGLMQLTWKEGYERYGSYINEDLVINYETVATNLFKAVDSAGWFWTKGKSLSSTTNWSPPSGAPSYVKQGISYPISKYSYSSDESTKKYNSINLNQIADDDHGDTISWLVNGGANGLQERRDYLALLKDMQIFICEDKECPEDKSRCFNYADVWDNPEISSDNGGKNNNRFEHGSTRGHKGVDILTGETYKTVHNLMCGEVVSLVDSFSTNEYKKSSLGNTLMIKSKDKSGNEVFILYCHLDSISVAVGAKVKHGQAVAVSGSTGNAAEILNANGSLKNGIRKANWHVHIEAATRGTGYNNFYSLGSYRKQPEDYMKTKFDSNGNAIN